MLIRRLSAFDVTGCSRTPARLDIRRSKYGSVRFTTKMQHPVFPLKIKQFPLPKLFLVWDRPISTLNINPRLVCMFARVWCTLLRLYGIKYLHSHDTTGTDCKDRSSDTRRSAKYAAKRSC